MTIDEAIKFKEGYLRNNAPFMTKNAFEAEELGIEALKAWKAIRDNPGMSFDTKLPGETKD